MKIFIITMIIWFSIWFVCVAVTAVRLKYMYPREITRSQDKTMCGVLVILIAWGFSLLKGWI